MTWTRLGDTFPTDPRLLECSRDARLLHVEALVYCNQHLTDGRMPYAALHRVTDSPDTDAAVAELVAVGLWVLIPGTAAWQVDWKEQLEADEVRRGQEYRAAKQKRYRDRKNRHESGDHSDCDPRFCPELSTSVTGNATSNVTGRVTRSRPVPSPNRDRERARARASTPAAPDAEAPRCIHCNRTATACRRAAAVSGDSHRFTTAYDESPTSADPDLAATLDEIGDALALGNDERPDEERRPVSELSPAERLSDVGKRREYAAFPASKAKPDSKLAAQRAARRSS